MLNSHFRRAVLCAASAALIGAPHAPAQPYASNNVQFLGRIPLNAMPTPQQAGSDCWGYVSPSGREYAIMGTYSSFVFVEVTTPTAPVLLAQFPGPDSTWRDVKVFGHHAYGVTEGGGGIYVFDMSDIDNGNVTFVHGEYGRDRHHRSDAQRRDQRETGYLYRCAGGRAPTASACGSATSSTTPDNPQYVGEWHGSYVHDVQVVVWNTGPLAGRAAFACCGTDGLRIVDVTNRRAPWSSARLCTHNLPAATRAG